jgi:hypothetical protein
VKTITCESLFGASWLSPLRGSERRFYNVCFVILSNNERCPNGATFMRKKWWLAIAFLALTIGGAIGVFVLARPTPGITYSNFSRLEQGMTRRQVEALLGQSNAKTHGLEGNIAFPFAVLPATGWTNWQNEAGDSVSIHFDADDCVNLTTWNSWSDDRTRWEKLRDRLPWVAKPPPAVLYLID